MTDTNTFRFKFPFPESDDLESEGLDRLQLDLADVIQEVERRDTVAGLSLGPAGIGVGASGSAFEVALEIWRSASDDADRLALVGGVIVWIWRRIRAKRGDGSKPTVEDENALAALGAHAVAPTLDLSGYRLVRGGEQSVPLNGWPGLGTDDRFVHAIVFERDGGRLLVLFMTPSGALIGHAFVPVAVTFNDGDLQERDADELGRLFREWNGLTQ